MTTPGSSFPRSSISNILSFEISFASVTLLKLEYPLLAIS